jgi:hypothetical protein
MARLYPRVGFALRKDFICQSSDLKPGTRIENLERRLVLWQKGR